MPDPNNRTGRDFSLYDAMDDEQLRQILRDDASKPEGEDTDMELILHIMEVLARRRKEANENIPPEQALEQFNKKYTYFDNSLISEEKPAKKKTLGFHRWQRWVATIAAMLILVFGSTLTAQAFGFDIFEIIAKWTQETFHLGSYSSGTETNAPDTNDNTQYKQLSLVLQQNGIEAKLAPTWFPEGYIEQEIKIQETPYQRQFVTQYKRGEQSVRIRIADYLSDYPSQVEQSDSLLECYSVSGVDYYIFENLDQLRAVWVVDSFECYITGPLSLDEIKAVIDSIEKG